MPKRCKKPECNAKLNLLAETIGTCLCKGVFCPEHRYPEDHQCTFNHKQHAREKLAKANPLVEAPKV